MNSEPLRRLLGLARRAADPTDDAGLLARFAANADADAFELLVWRHGGMVLGVAKRILGDAHAAEDAFQATFLALARQAKSVRRDGCVAGWLHRVARRVAMRAKIRGERRTVRPTCLDSSEHVGLTARRSPDDPIDAAAQREVSQVLDEELDRLPERFRRAVVLCYLEGRSTAEAAERLGCPRGTVLSRLATAREKLRVRLLRRGVAPAIAGLAITAATDAPAALVYPTVRAVVANTAAPQVIDLCDGVIRAMILSKLKMTAAVVMTFSLIGGGAGWVALTPGGPGVALAGPRAKATPKSDPPATALDQDRRRKAEDEGKQQAAATESLTNALAMAAGELMDSEKKWSDERTEARLRVAEAEEKYRRLERLSLEATPEAAQVREEERVITNAKSELEKMEKMGGSTGELIIQLHKQIESRQNQLNKARDKYDLRQKELAQAVLEARRELVAAEEHLSLGDRLISTKRQEKALQVEELGKALALVRTGAFRPDPTERKIRELDRKLDDVLRELTELRRELRK